MEIATLKKEILISHQKYVLNLLKETKMFRCKLADTSMNPNIKLESKINNALVDKERYQRIVDKLIYLLHIRHDINFALIW